MLAGAGLTGGSVAGGAGRYRKIAVEEGFLVPEIGQAFGRFLQTETAKHVGFAEMERYYRDLVPTWTERGLDLGEGRLQQMDDHGIDMQLLVLSAGALQWLDADEATPLAALANDRAAAAMQKYPDRFAALAAVAPQDPQAAAAELDRAINKLGLKGLLINSNVGGEYLDDRKYWPIFEAAESLDVPIYLHPSLPSPQIIEPYRDYGLVGPMAGFNAETHIHALRLIMSGVFDRFPDLKLVLGHAGEGIPFFIDRIDRAHTNTMNNRSQKLERLPSEYLTRNCWLTTSGMNSPSVVRYCIERMGPDRVMFAIDYPYEKMMPDATALDDMDVPEDVKRMLFHENAERLFDLA
jgi:2,3-dihydroxybenzoate decarboxylase